MTTVSTFAPQASQTLTISGRITKNPAQKLMKSGEPFTRFAIVYTETIIEEDEIRESSRFLDIDAFGAFSDYCLDRLKKGDRIQVTGRVRKRPYQTKDGESRIAEEISLGGADGRLKILSRADSSDDVEKQAFSEDEEIQTGGEA